MTSNKETRLNFRNTKVDNKIGRDLSRSKNIYGENFPTRSNYEQYCVSKGYANSPEEVWLNDQAVKMIQRHWHHTGQNGCVFAQSIAYKQEQIGWESVVIRDLTPNGITKLDNKIDISVNDPSNEVISFLFPNLIDAEQISTITEKLIGLNNIQIGFNTTHGDMITLGLRTPLAEGSILSWIVGFAPLTYLPETRQAPVFELAIRTKTKGDNLFYRLNDSEDEAHLADVPTGYNDKTMKRLWVATYNRTRKILGGNEARKANPFASAKVTIALPVEHCSFLEK